MNQISETYKLRSVPISHSSAVVSMAAWILSELIRVFHSLTTKEAQQLVDSLSERRIPIVWKGEEVRRVLKLDLILRDHILLLLMSSSGKASADDVFKWSGKNTRKYFNRIVRRMHDKHLIEFSEDSGRIELLPPGNEAANKILDKLL